jgi:hypothetical protein
MPIITNILKRSEFFHEPPILLDIGASGNLHDKWKEIAKYSVCIAFDADDRDIHFVEKETENYKKLYVFNRIVTDRDTDELDFYLTKSPHCSTTLMPDHDKIQDWEFAELFTVQKKIKLKAVVLRDVFAELGVKKIDWFKTDSQGTDLRLFKSLGEEIMSNTLIAEFEPGIIDVYKGEDKLHHLMSYMDQMPFWMSNIHVLGCRRINQDILQRPNVMEKKALQALRISPGWAEVVYINTFRNENFSKRDYLLGCIFAMIEKQYGFALELSMRGYEKFKDADFKEIKQYIVAQMKSDFDTKSSYQRQQAILATTDNRLYFLKILRRLVVLARFSTLFSVGNLQETRARGVDVDLTVEQDHSSVNSPFFLRAESRGYRRAQYRFWGKKGNDFEILREWDADNILILSEKHKDYHDYGVHIRSGEKGEWQDQAWVINEVWKSNDQPL